MAYTQAAEHREPWHKGKIVGQKAPLKLKDRWVGKLGLTPRPTGRTPLRRQVLQVEGPERVDQPISADPIVDLVGRKQSVNLSSAEADLHN